MFWNFWPAVYILSGKYLCLFFYFFFFKQLDTTGSILNEVCFQVSFGMASFFWPATELFLWWKQRYFTSGVVISVLFSQFLLKHLDSLALSAQIYCRCLFCDSLLFFRNRQKMCISKTTISRETSDGEKRLRQEAHTSVSVIHQRAHI